MKSITDFIANENKAADRERTCFCCGSDSRLREDQSRRFGYYICSDCYDRSLERLGIDFEYSELGGQA